MTSEYGPVGAEGPADAQGATSGPLWAQVAYQSTQPAPWFANMPSDLDAARASLQANYTPPPTYQTPDVAQFQNESPLTNVGRISQELFDPLSTAGVPSNTALLSDIGLPADQLPGPLQAGVNALRPSVFLGPEAIGRNALGQTASTAADEALPQNAPGLVRAGVDLAAFGAGAASPEIAGGLNALGDESVLNAATGPRETSSDVPLGSMRLPGRPNTFLPVNYGLEGGAPFSEEEMRAQQVHLNNEVQDNPDLTSAIAKIQDNIAIENQLRSAEGPVQGELKAGSARQAAGAAAARQSALSGNLSVKEAAQQALEGMTTGGNRQTFAPGANLTPEEDKALAHLLATSPPLRNKPLTYGNLTSALDTFLGGGTIQPEPLARLSDLLGVSLEEPPIGPRGSGQPASFPASFENNPLFDPDALYRQPDGNGGFVTGQTGLGETPPVTSTYAQQTANDARYAENITPTGAAQAIDPAGELRAPEVQPFEPGVQGSMMAPQALENGQYTRIDPETGNPISGGRVESTEPLGPRMTAAEAAELQTRTGAAQAIDPARINAAGNFPNTPGATRTSGGYQPDMFGARGVAPEESTGQVPTNRGATAPEIPGIPQPKQPSLLSQWFQQIKSNPWKTAVDTSRTAQTTLDWAGPGRLGPQVAMVYPKAYANSLAELGRTTLARDPEGVIQASWDAHDSSPVMQRTNATTSTAFTPTSEGGFGLKGAETDPYTNKPSAGGGTGLITNQRAQVLQNWLQVLRPKMLEAEITNRIVAAGKDAIEGDKLFDPATGEDGTAGQRALIQKIAYDPKTRADIGRAVNLASGTSQWRIGGDLSNIFLNFPNWLAAQAEILQKGGFGIAKTAANLIPGVDIPISSTEQVAARATSRLAALGTIATVAFNAAQGVSPTDPRASRNGVPMVVLTPALTSVLNNTPGVGAAKFAPNTQFDAYGPLGEFMQRVAGLGVSAKEGFAGQFTKNSGVGGAAEGAANAAMSWGRGLLNWPSSTILDTATGQTAFGQKPTLQNEAPLPFNVSGLVGEDNRSPGVEALSTAGFRFHEPSPSAALDNALRANTKFGVPYASLNPSQRAQALVDPDIAPLIQAKDAHTSQLATPAAQSLAYEQVARDRIEGAAQDLKSGKTSTGQPFGPQDFRATLQDAESKLATQRDVVYATAKAQPGKDPVLDGYYAILDKTDPVTQKPDYDALDAYVASLNPDQQKYLDKNTGLAFSDIPEVKQYRQDVKEITQSGYWDISDKAATAYAQQLGLSGVTDRATMLAGIERMAKIDTQGNPNAAPLVINQLLRPYNRIVGAEHTALLAKRADIAKLLTLWGYSASARGVAAAGAATP